MGHQRRNSSLSRDDPTMMNNQVESNQQQNPEKSQDDHQQQQQESPIIQRLADEISLADLFDLFIEASTLRNVLAVHHRMLNYLDLNPCQFNIFFPTLQRAVLTNRKRKNWKAAAIFAKIDRRASHRCYQNNKSATATTQTSQDNYEQPASDWASNHGRSHDESDACSNNNNAMRGYNCLIVGSGPVGLRTAIELQLLGAERVVIVEKRSRFSRNNVLHLWPFVIEDLKSLGAKKFYGKFCAGSIDHISIRQIQLILLKICLMIGCDFRDCCSFVGLCPASLNNADGTTNICDIGTTPRQYGNNSNVDDDLAEEGVVGIKNNNVVLLETQATTVSASPIPPIDDDNSMEFDERQNQDNSTSFDSSRKKSSQLIGSQAHFECGFPLQENELHQIEWDVIVGADGRRNTWKTYFPRKEFRGKLAIAITANFINSQTPAEAKIPEISGISYIYNQDLFKSLSSDTNILLENICYYKDDTHYFVMTAQKRSLLKRDVLVKDYATTNQLLSEDNINRKALLEYAKDAARWTTGLEPLNFALNHYGQEDCAMFDFTSMYAASNACKALETKNGGLVLISLVGDSLLEPFWPTGSGCARGFLSSLDAAWMCRQWAVNKCPIVKPKSRNATDNENNTALNNNLKFVLGVIAERESIYRLLAQTTTENLHQNYSHWTLNPHTRYPNLNRHLVIPSQIRNLVGYHDEGSSYEDHNENISKSIVNKSSDTATSSRNHRSRLISPNTLSKKSKKSKLQNNSSSSNNINKLSASNQNRNQYRSTSRSSSRQTSKSNKQQLVLSPPPHHHGNRHSKSNESLSGFTESLKEFELSCKNLTTKQESNDKNNKNDCGDLPSPITGCSYEEIIRAYPMPLLSLSGTTPSANNLVSLEARRARDIDECLRHRREQNNKGARREELLKRLQPTYGKKGSANALIGAAAIYRDMMRGKRDDSNSSDDVSGGGSIRRCASFAERVKSFENRLSESYGLSSSPTTAKDKTNSYIDDIRNLPQFATLQEMFVTNSTLNSDKDSSVKKKGKMPIMKLSKEDWNVKCWEDRLVKYHNRQMSYDGYGNGSHLLTSDEQTSKSKSPIRKSGGNVDGFGGRKSKRPEKQVEVFKGRIKEMADKLKRPCETKRQVSRYDYLLGSSAAQLTTPNPIGNSHGASRSHEWVKLIQRELAGTNKKNEDSNNSSTYSSRHKRVVKKLFDDDDDAYQNEHQHYDHLCLNRPKDNYLSVNNYTSCLSRAPKDATFVQSRLTSGKKNSYDCYEDVVETSHALTQSSVNSGNKKSTTNNSGSIGESSSASSTISELSSNNSIKGNPNDKSLMNADNNNRPHHSSARANSMCIRCKSSVATIDKVVIDYAIVHRSCLTCSKCDVRLRMNEVKPRLTNTRNTNSDNSKYQQSSFQKLMSLSSSTQQTDKQLLDEAMKMIQLDDGSTVVYDFICVICQSSLRHMQPSVANLEMESAKTMSTNNREDVCGGIHQTAIDDVGQRIKQKVKSREEFLDQQVDYSTLYKSILDDTVSVEQVNGENSSNSTKATCFEGNGEYQLGASDKDNTDETNPTNRRISPEPESPERLTSDKMTLKDRDATSSNSDSSHAGNEHASSEEDQNYGDISERVGFELSSRRLVDEDELEKMLHLDSNSCKNQDEELSISSVEGSTSGTTSDLKSISSSSYDNDDLDDGGADPRDKDGDDASLREMESSISSQNASSQEDEDAADLVVEQSSLNSPPNTNNYDDDEDDDEDRNSTYNDFLTSEEFDYSFNASKIHASPMHSHDHNNHHTNNSGATNSINSTPSRILRSNISSEADQKGSPRKQPPEIVIDYQDGGDTITKATTTNDVLSPIDNEAVENQD